MPERELFKLLMHLVRNQGQDKCVTDMQEIKISVSQTRWMDTGIPEIAWKNQAFISTLKLSYQRLNVHINSLCLTKLSTSREAEHEKLKKALSSLLFFFFRFHPKFLPLHQKNRRYPISCRQ